MDTGQGDGQRVINRPEAEALVEAVTQCCKDEQYKGMSFGVITLQGEAQAYLIEDLLLKSIGAEEMQKRRLICGNPYSFQVMNETLFSLAWWLHQMKEVVCLHKQLIKGDLMLLQAEHRIRCGFSIQ
ncbi:MAG: hypothetical protein M0C28_22595 [Candidatus Moduliflexus flocculans]|nr:hypothetical protein [Candidatus Moduliflexus flocculans]